MNRARSSGLTYLCLALLLGCSGSHTAKGGDDGGATEASANPSLSGDDGGTSNQGNSSGSTQDGALAVDGGVSGDGESDGATPASGDGAAAAADATTTNDGSAADGSAGGDGAVLGGDGAVLGGDGAVLGGDGAVLGGDGGAIRVDGGGVLCGDHTCACADGVDNDHDGRTDLADPECISSWDDDEDSFATGMPGDNRDDACQDCFFDGNSGSGNDGCRVPTSCLLDGTASSGHGSCSQCEQPTRCQTYCQPYTPNGCDCFGCCDVRVTATDIRHVLLGAGCSLDGDTLSGCTSCVPSTTCNNPCGRCELCPGKTVADLPADCTPSGSTPDAGPATEPPAPTCEGGAIVCGEGYALCSAGSLCQFGCCVLTPVLP